MTTDELLTKAEESLAMAWAILESDTYIHDKEVEVTRWMDLARAYRDLAHDYRMQGR